MKANQDYDYFFEIDGERKYDSDFDFRTVSLFNYAVPTQSMNFNSHKFCQNSQAPVAAHQIIIANQIQIGKGHQHISSGSSTCSSASYSTCNLSMWEPTGPVVAWPENVLDLLQNVRELV